MSAADKIREHIANIPEGEPFSSSSLRFLATSDNVRQILNRMVNAGEIRRVGRGLFVKPIQTARFGETLPSVQEIAKTLASTTGETIAIHGAEAARQLQLTTQVPMKIVFYTSGNTRTLKIANRTVQLKHVNPSKLIASGTTVGAVISALMYLGQDNVTTDTIKAIRSRISDEDYNTVLKLINRLPAWLADIFYEDQRK